MSSSESLSLSRRELVLLKTLESSNGEALKGLGEGFLLEVPEEPSTMFANLIPRQEEEVSVDLFC